MSDQIPQSAAIVAVPFVVPDRNVPLVGAPTFAYGEFRALAHRFHGVSVLFLQLKQYGAVGYLPETVFHDVAHRVSGVTGEDIAYHHVAVRLDGVIAAPAFAAQCAGPG